MLFRTGRRLVIIIPAFGFCQNPLFPDRPGTFNLSSGHQPAETYVERYSLEGIRMREHWSDLYKDDILLFASELVDPS